MANNLIFENNDLLAEENTRVSSDLQFSQKCINLLEKYRKCLINFKNRCICEENIENETDFEVLENNYKILREKQIIDTNLNIKTEDIETHNNEERNESNDKDFDENQELSDNWIEDNSEDTEESDGEYNTKKTRPKRLKTETNDQKKKWKTYYNHICDWIGCERKFCKRDDLLAHISSSHTKERPFKCEVCSKCFATVRYLKIHQKIHPNFKPKIIIKEIVEKKTFICDLNNCGKVFKSKILMEKHQSTVHSDERPFVCEWPGCNQAYKIKVSLSNHRAIHSDEQFKCDFEGCLKTFKTKWSYCKHKRTHKPKDQEKPSKYMCEWPGCNHDATNKRQLTIHMNRHLNIKPFKCQTVGCDMSYYTKYHLNLHKIRVHEVVNESDFGFKCHIDGCQKSYAVKHDLTKHLRRHDKIYVCSWPECDQRYAAKQLLSDHMDRHMNVKSYHCQSVGCGKSFFAKNNFETHMKNMHKYNPNKFNKK